MIQYLHMLLVDKKAKMDERGASAVEYGLLVAGIAALIVAVVFLFGNFIQGIFSSTCTSINASMASPSSGC
jgi:pilus assembly protein Flp/PilA